MFTEVEEVREVKKTWSTPTLQPLVKLDEAAGKNVHVSETTRTGTSGPAS